MEKRKPFTGPVFFSLGGRLGKVFFKKKIFILPCWENQVLGGGKKGGGGKTPLLKNNKRGQKF